VLYRVTRNQIVDTRNVQNLYRTIYSYLSREPIQEWRAPRVAWHAIEHVLLNVLAFAKVLLNVLAVAKVLLNDLAVAKVLLNVLAVAKVSLNDLAVAKVLLNDLAVAKVQPNVILSCDCFFLYVGRTK
jgi:hypothetical protein